MKKFVKENKLVSTIISSCLGFAILWAIWVTNGIYIGRQTEAVAGEIVEQISKDIKSVKGDIKSIRDELKDQSEKAQKEKDKWFEILLDIKKQTKDNNKNK